MPTIARLNATGSPNLVASPRTRVQRVSAGRPDGPDTAESVGARTGP